LDAFSTKKSTSLYVFLETAQRNGAPMTEGDTLKDGTHPGQNLEDRNSHQYLEEGTRCYLEMDLGLNLLVYRLEQPHS
jgi:hypothetical protein